MDTAPDGDNAMHLRPCLLVVLASLCGLDGCVLKNSIIDEAQVDSMTFCAVADTKVPLTESEKTWGRVRGEGGRVYWSHYSLGTFACKTQDEWLCEARTGKTQCSGQALDRQLGLDSDAKTTAYGADERKLLRNETQSEMLLQADRICDRYLASVFGEQAGRALEMDVWGSLLSGGAALASGVTARNLAAGSAFLGATKSHINADVYQNQVATAINLLIRKKRNVARGVIRNNQACNVAAYSATDAVKDALTYHDMCSFEYGLGELVHEASNTSPVRGSVASLTLQRLQKQLADLLAKPVGAADTAAKADYDKTIADLRSQIRVYEGFGVEVPVTSAAAATPQDTPGAAKAVITDKPSEPVQSVSTCAPLPVVPLSG
jgi:hypothetical protein